MQIVKGHIHTYADRVITLTNKNDKGQPITINVEGFNLNPKKDDAIFAIIKDGKLCKYPLIQPTTITKDVIRKITVFGTDEIFGYHELSAALWNLYKSFKKDADIENGEDRFIMHLNLCSDLFFRFYDRSSILKFAKEVKIPESNCEKILRSWAQEYLVRRITLLGVSNESIQEGVKIGYSLMYMYESLISFPYRLYFFPYNDIILPIKILNMEDEKTDVYLSVHNVLYKYYYDIKDKGMCGIKKYEKIQSIKTDELMKNFKLTIYKDHLLLNFQNRNLKIIKNYLAKLATRERKVTIDEKYSEHLSTDQKKALINATTRGISLITGGAGTGKSTTLAAIVNSLGDKPGVFVLSFTGKATYRIKEISKTVTASTIHRFIMDYNKGLHKVVRHLLIDESSNFSTQLFSNLIYCVSEHKEEIDFTLSGDVNQLNPIDYGSYFRALLESDLPKVRLTTDFRRSNTELNSIINGFVEGELLAEETGDFKIHFSKDGMSLTKMLMSYYFDEGVNDREFTAVVPYNKHTQEINEYIVNKYYSANKKIRDDFGKTWYVGQKVMLTENSYEIGVMNGEEGKILDVNEGAKLITVLFNSDEPVVIPTYKPPEEKKRGLVLHSKKPLCTKLLVDSYAITVDKSQGSQWEYVVVYIPEHKSGFINMNRIYTAASRVKTRLDIVCDCSRETFLKSLKTRPFDRNYEIEKYEEGEKFE